VDGHAFAECGHLLRHGAGGFRAHAVGPLAQRGAGRGEQPLDLFVAQLRGHRDRRQLRPVQDLVRVRVADAGEEPRIGQGALQRMVLPLQPFAERADIGAEDLDAARIESLER